MDRATRAAARQERIGALPFSEHHYSDLRRRHIFRLLATYLGPLVLLTIYLFVQYDAIVRESERLHLQAIAESQAGTFNLYLTERVVNLTNLIEDPHLVIPPSSADMAVYLARLQRNSDAFVDVGYFDSEGRQESYAGPFPSLEDRDYSGEEWYLALQEKQPHYVITDIYLGFRQRPHFTIAVSRRMAERLVVLRATLDPERMHEYLRSLEGGHEVLTSILNRDGLYQLVTPRLGKPLETAPFVPPRAPSPWAGRLDVKGFAGPYAYAWLPSVEWVLLVRQAPGHEDSLFSGVRLRLLLIALAVVVLGIFMILYRSLKLVEFQRESDRTRAQLSHAAKLASVGELAAGIAHEINNPLASIKEEAGLMKDMLDPQFGESLSTAEIVEHLDSIQSTVLRCRDITHKLLKFVRKDDVDLRRHNVHRLIDGVVDGLLGPEVEVSPVIIKRDYDGSCPEITTDGNQLQQVLLNVLKNAMDAVGEVPGTITIHTGCVDGKLEIGIRDTGCGISPEQLHMLFMPFYTTKEVGKGTGLGLSVSYTIMNDLGGYIDVESEVGTGSTFTLVLPVR
ncbi:MAG: ATP-binding protein [Pseudomonadota bacterium]